MATAFLLPLPPLPLTPRLLLLSWKAQARPRLVDAMSTIFAQALACRLAKVLFESLKHHERARERKARGKENGLLQVS